ncbi:MAG TPA: hypothetical protein VIA62_14090 [Thermoanaerobaculia bacterium]|jgi:hypothetical protein|nr:hypothetical protein [Thermoanaerobaculia bacterium]
MLTKDHKEPRQPSGPTDYFAETAIGAVVLLSIQFLSLPVLVGGLALIGITKLFLRLRTGSTE